MNNTCFKYSYGHNKTKHNNVKMPFLQYIQMLFLQYVYTFFSPVCTNAFLQYVQILFSSMYKCFSLQMADTIYYQIMNGWTDGGGVDPINMVKKKVEFYEFFYACRK